MKSNLKNKIKNRNPAVLPKVNKYFLFIKNIYFKNGIDKKHPLL